jgi:hypothetical protein
MARKEKAMAQDSPEAVALLLEVPFSPGTEMTSGMRLDVHLSRVESQVFHGIGHALVRSGTRLKDGTPLDYGRSFRTNVLRYLIERVELAALDQARGG